MRPKQGPSHRSAASCSILLYRGKRAAVIGGGLGVAIAYPQAKALHDELELQYRPYMDFPALTDYTNAEIERIFGN